MSAEIERLKEQLDAALHAFRVRSEYCDRVVAERDRLKVENIDLKGRLVTMHDVVYTACNEGEAMETQRDELLEAAQEVVDVVGGGVAIDESAKPSPTLKRLRAAIAKATP